MISRAEADELRLQRLREHTHARRLAKDIGRYGQLYPTPWIERQLAARRADYAATADRLAEINARLGEEIE